MTGYELDPDGGVQEYSPAAFTTTSTLVASLPLAPAGVSVKARP